MGDLHIVVAVVAAGLAVGGAVGFVLGIAIGAAIERRQWWAWIARSGQREGQR